MSTLEKGTIPHTNFTKEKKLSCQENNRANSPQNELE